MITSQEVKCSILALNDFLARLGSTMEKKFLDFFYSFFILHQISPSLATLGDFLLGVYLSICILDAKPGVAGPGIQVTRSPRAPINLKSSLEEFWNIFGIFDFSIFFNFEGLSCEAAQGGQRALEPILACTACRDDHFHVKVCPKRTFYLEVSSIASL